MSDVFIESSEISLDPIAFCLVYNGEASAELTSLEFRILSLFEAMKYRPLAKDEIQKRIWGRAQSKDKTLNVHFTYLRRKLLSLDLTVRYLKSGSFVLAPTDKALDYSDVIEA